MQLIEVLDRIRSAVGKGILKTAISNIGSTFSLRLVGSFVSLLLEILLIRSLGYSDYSEYTYVWIFVRLSGILLSLGFDRLDVRFVSEYSHNNSIGKLKGLILFSYILVTAISTLALFGIVLLSKSSFVQSFVTIKGVLDIFFIASPALVFIAIQELHTVLLRGLSLIHI